jgi:hypothetical protein
MSGLGLACLPLQLACPTFRRNALTYGIIRIHAPPWWRSATQTRFLVSGAIRALDAGTRTSLSIHHSVSAIR